MGCNQKNCRCNAKPDVVLIPGPYGSSELRPLIMKDTTCAYQLEGVMLLTTLKCK